MFVLSLAMWIKLSKCSCKGLGGSLVVFEVVSKDDIMCKMMLWLQNQGLC